MTGITNYKEWYNMKRAILKGLDCVLCGKPATQLHHLKKTSDYPTSYDYWNDETQIPCCRDCHFRKFHIMSKGKLNTETGIVWSKCMGGGFD